MTKGILAVWTDADPENEDDFNEWYNREHMFERVGVPDFHRARRYLTVSGAPKYFAYYVTDDAAVMASEPYLARLNDPSPWTTRNVARFLNTNRSACNLLRRFGHGSGAAALTIRLAGDAGREGELIGWLGDDLMPALMQRPGIVGAQLWRADRDASLVPAAERDLRAEPDQVADLVIFVEATDLEPLTGLADAELSASSLAAHGAADGAQTNVHRLLCSVEKEDPPEV